jgi:hypothetical protein
VAADTASFRFSLDDDCEAIETIFNSLLKILLQNPLDLR